MQVRGWYSRWWRGIAHRWGFIASPSLAFFEGVPFGPKKRDLAGEVMRDIAASHDPRTCPMCSDNEALEAIYGDHDPDKTLIILPPPEPCEVGDRGPWCDSCDCRYL